jgi:hypothetical protein
LEIGLAVDAARALEGALAYCSTIDAQLEVLGRVVEALRSAWEWPAVLKAIARLRTLQHSHRTIDHHDAFEIVEFEALRRTEIAIAPLLSRAQKCIYNDELPASHRVWAACNAVKLATLLPDFQELQRIYFAIGSLLNESSVDFRSRLQIQVVYHTMCGDLRRALTLAKERVSAERMAGNPVMLANAVSDLAFVLRRTGPDTEIELTLREAYDIAIQHKLFAASREYAEWVLTFFLDRGRQDIETWMERSVKSYGDGPVRATFAVQASFARIALFENRIADAESIVDQFDWGLLRHRRGWLAAALALRIKTKIARMASAEEVGPHVEELLKLYEAFATIGCQDLEVAGLCRGLLYLDQRGTAKRYLEDYVCNKRRDLTPYLDELTSVCTALDATLLKGRDVVGTIMNREVSSAPGDSILSSAGLGLSPPGDA